MGVGLAFQQASPGHHGVGIVPAAVPVLHGIFQQGGEVGLDGLLQFALDAEADAPCLGQFQAAAALLQVSERKESAGLGKDLAFQPAPRLLGGNQVRLGVLGEGGKTLLVGLGYGLPAEGDLTVQGAHVHVLGV